MVGQVTGSIFVRPVRLAMVFEPDLATLRRAVEEATSLWGGLHQLLLEARNPEHVLKMARGLGVDVLWPFDHAYTSTQATDHDGYRWRGRGEWAPLAPPQEVLSSRLYGPEKWFDDAIDYDGWVLPRWDADDPLRDLYAVWFGCYGQPELGTALEASFAPGADEILLEIEQPIPTDATSWISPIVATTRGMKYMGESYGTGFIIVDPQNAADLIMYWNVRAAGVRVFPWPVGNETKVTPAARAWLQKRRDSGDLSGWRTGDGRPLGPRVWVWKTNEPEQQDSHLNTLLAEEGVRPIYDLIDIELMSLGWRGPHPYSTEFKSNFSALLDEHRRSVDVPVPRLDSSKRLRSGTVAVQIEISQAAGVSPGWTFLVPNVRTLAPLLDSYHDFDVTSHSHRPTADGRVIAVSTRTDTVQVSAVPSFAIFDKLIESPGWRSRQSDEGVFISRLIDRLGGVGSTIANQPGARAGLVEAARARDGRTSAAIVERIRQYQGDWPSAFATDEAKREYPPQIFRYLLVRAILRPVLPVACPYCTAKTAVRPEDLTTQMKCEMCLQDFPLGLALGMSSGGQNPWLYGLAGHVRETRLQECLPIMATLTTLAATARSLAFPHVLGWKLTGPSLDCEIDIVAALDFRGLPVIVVGETKSYRDSIDQADLDSLGCIQDHFRTKGIECVALIAVMRELRQQERDLLRAFCSRLPSAISFGSRLEPVLPIIFTERELSATELTGSIRVVGRQLMVLLESRASRAVGIWV